MDKQRLVAAGTPTLVLSVDLHRWRRYAVIGHTQVGWMLKPYVRSWHFTPLGAHLGRLIGNQIGLGIGEYEVQKAV